MVHVCITGLMALQSDACFRLLVDSDLAVGPFYTNRPDRAVPELERYLEENWGRTKVEVIPIFMNS